MRLLFILALGLALQSCQTAPEPVDTPATRAAKAAVLAAAAKDAYEHREFTQAIEQARHGLQLDATSLDSWYWLGMALFASNQDDEAFTTSKRFVELGAARPDREGQLAQAYDRLGWISFRKGRMDDAAKYFSLAIERAPTLAHALDGRGQIAYFKKDYPAAIRDFSKALGLGSTAHQIAVESRGLAYYWMGNFAKALPDLKAAFESTGADRRTDRKDLLRARAFCHLALGEQETATNLFARSQDFSEEERRYNFAVMTYLTGDKELALRQAGKRTGIGLKEAKLNAATIARVDKVAPGSPAEKAGVQVGDEITMANGVPVSNLEQYREVMRSIPPDTKFTLSIVRNGAKRELSLTMGDAEYVIKSDPYLAPLLAKPLRSKN
ncbi:MAG: PDZ domain-containing protein [Nitrospira sp.]|nr:PDZ domain-containing protein [Nitrospira sp.]